MAIKIKLTIRKIFITLAIFLILQLFFISLIYKLSKNRTSKFSKFCRRYGLFKFAFAKTIKPAKPPKIPKIKKVRVKTITQIKKEFIKNMTVFSEDQKENFNSDLLVLVISGRKYFERREMVRNTWAKNEDSVYFLVGQEFCGYPNYMLADDNSCKLSGIYDRYHLDFDSENSGYNLEVNPPLFNNTPISEYQFFSKHSNDLKNRQGVHPIDGHVHNNTYIQNLIWNVTIHRRDEIKLTKKLKKEEKVVLLPISDTYANLTMKWKLGVQKIYNHFVKKKEKFRPKYILKTDDDCIVRVQTLSRFLDKFYKVQQQQQEGEEEKENEQKQETHPYLYMGWYADTKPVGKIGKWAEFKYKKEYFPRYAIGLGYIISWNIAEYIAQNFDNLINYTNEDTSTGIWIDEAPFKNNVSYVNNDLVHGRWVQNNQGLRCCDTKNVTACSVNSGIAPLMLGHDLGPEVMRDCWDEIYLGMH